MHVRSHVVDPFDRTMLVMKILTGLCFAVAALGLVGELLGWWDLAGELLVSFGGVAGLILGGLTMVTGAGRGQVRGVASDVRSVGADVRAVATEVRAASLKLDKLDQLDKLDRLDELDIIEAELNFQSGALDRQVAILTQIRDRL